MERVVVLGGSGFVGRAFCEQWVTHFGAGGPRLVVPTRHRERCKHLFTLPTVDVISARLTDDQGLAQLLRGADAVVNLVGILHGRSPEFENAHVDLPQRLVMACVKAGVHRLVHLSALGVGEDSTALASVYLTTKANGERAMWTAHGPHLAVTVLRPSVIFGEHDRFLNLFAQLQAWMPVVLLPAAQATFQPVWVEDVARALVHSLLHPETAGQTLECVGPQVYTLAELVRLAGHFSGHPRPVLEVPLAVGRVQAAMLSMWPGEPLMSQDNLDSMSVPNVATGRHPTLPSWGIVPASVEAVAPHDLSCAWGVPDRFNLFRSWAGR